MLAEIESAQRVLSVSENTVPLVAMPVEMEEQPPQPEPVKRAEPETPKPSEKWMENFNRVHAHNPDTVGTLTAGNDIKTYVVQRNNSYYLTRGYNGKKNKSGAIFADAGCSVDSSGRHIILHGHNMKNGTAFGKLYNFFNESYLDTFPVIRFATPQEDAYYAVFSVLEISILNTNAKYFDIFRFGFASNEDFLSFAAAAKARSSIDIPVDVQTGDRLLTMMTCTLGNDDKRIVVMARKLRSAEDADQFRLQNGTEGRALIYKKGKAAMKGADVQAIQEALTKLSYFQGKCDGVYGKKTAVAVHAFQTDNGLKADGMVGENTRHLVLDMARAIEEDKAESVTAA